MANTGNIFIDTLAGVSWLDVGGDRNITYSFDETPLTHRLWTVVETVVWEAALQPWANVANITTQRVSSFAGADLHRDVADVFVHAGSPRRQFSLLSRPSERKRARHRRIQHARSLYVFLDRRVGSRRRGLLDFPGDDRPCARSRDPRGASSRRATAPDLVYNQELYSVLSHNHGTKTSSGSVDFGHAATPMAFDIAAIQSMYGPNTSYRTGSDTYVLPDTNAPGTFWQCIWDAGGTDTIRYNGKSERNDRSARRDTRQRRSQCRGIYFAGRGHLRWIHDRERRGHRKRHWRERQRYAHRQFRRQQSRWRRRRRQCHFSGRPRRLHGDRSGRQRQGHRTGGDATRSRTWKSWSSATRR